MHVPGIIMEQILFSDTMVYVGFNNQMISHL